MEAEKMVNPLRVGNAMEAEKSVDPLKIGNAMEAEKSVDPLKIGNAMEPEKMVNPRRIGNAMEAEKSVDPLKIGNAMEAEKSVNPLRIGNGMEAEKMVSPLRIGKAMEAEKSVDLLKIGKNDETDASVGDYRSKKFDSDASIGDYRSKKFNSDASIGNYRSRNGRSESATNGAADRKLDVDLDVGEGLAPLAPLEERIGKESVVTIDTIDKRGHRSEQRAAHTYAAKKTVAQGMMDVALITANANQLRYLVEYQRDSPTFYFIVFLIVVSLLLQIAVGVSLIFKGRFDIQGKGKSPQARMINNYVVVGVFLITIINVFVAAFSVTGTSVTVVAPPVASRAPA